MFLSQKSQVFTQHLSTIQNNDFKIQQLHIFLPKYRLTDLPYITEIAIVIFLPTPTTCTFPVS